MKQIITTKNIARLLLVFLFMSQCTCSSSSSKQAAASQTDSRVFSGFDVGTSVDGNIKTNFLATPILGRPTSTSIAVSAVPRLDLEIFFEYGTSSRIYTGRTTASIYPGEKPFITKIEELTADKQYYYRMNWRVPGSSTFSVGPECSFHTARAKNQTFVFTVQSDPHLDEISNLELYQRTLANELADAPDFMIDLGDTFMCEKYSTPFTSTVQAAPDYSTVAARYLYERGNFGIVAHSAPLFLVNGNHEGEAGWLLNGTQENLAVWATQARKTFFPIPWPDDFYWGKTADEPFVGQRGSYYAWEWGDALFLVLDPYWYTTSRPKQDGWVWTLGQEQYLWLQETLQKSSSRFKFVFIHNLLGGLDAQMRGGIEAAPFYEWGGKNIDGTSGFDVQRAGWAKPIHELLKENHVTALFHGHDHVYVKQELDGIIYQELPQPSAPNFESGPSLAAKFHYQSGTIVSSAGHLRVTVSPDKTKVEYVRAFRPQDENSERHNGDVSDSYTLMPR